MNEQRCMWRLLKRTRAGWSAWGVVGVVARSVDGCEGRGVLHAQRQREHLGQTGHLLALFGGWRQWRLGGGSQRRNTQGRTHLSWLAGRAGHTLRVLLAGTKRGGPIGCLCSVRKQLQCT